MKSWATSPTATPCAARPSPSATRARRQQPSSRTSAWAASPRLSTSARRSLTISSAVPAPVASRWTGGSTKGDDGTCTGSPPSPSISTWPTNSSLLGIIFFFFVFFYPESPWRERKETIATILGYYALFIWGFYQPDTPRDGQTGGKKREITSGMDIRLTPRDLRIFLSYAAGYRSILRTPLGRPHRASRKEEEEEEEDKEEWLSKFQVPSEYPISRRFFFSRSFE